MLIDISNEKYDNDKRNVLQIYFYQNSKKAKSNKNYLLTIQSKLFTTSIKIYVEIIHR